MLLERGFLLVADEYVTLRSANYQLTVYAVEVISKYNFNMWGNETGAIEWLSVRRVPSTRPKRSSEVH